MIVLDASVVLKWFIEEDDQARASKWRDAHIAGDEIVAVPEMLYFEVANVMAIAKRMTPEDSNIAFSLLWAMDLERFDFGREEFLDAMNLARNNKITLYDAVYVALAQRLGTKVVTADRKLFEKTRGLGIVELL